MMSAIASLVPLPLHFMAIEKLIKNKEASGQAQAPSIWNTCTKKSCQANSVGAWRIQPCSEAPCRLQETPGGLEKAGEYEYDYRGWNP